MIFTRRFGALRARQSFLPSLTATDTKVRETELTSAQVKPHDTVLAQTQEQSQSGHRKHAA